MGRRGPGLNPSRRLKEVLTKAYASLISISESDSNEKPQPDKWSAKEIIGHLTDSALINHQRFVRALQQDHLIMDGYEQDFWVSAQQYQSRKWPDLLELWKDLNEHIASFVEYIPVDQLDRLVVRHNLDQILTNPIPRTQPATIRLLIDDYIDHMVHHIRQILKDFEE
jgi:uncharacterized damage-inducible protein DinB